MRLKFLLLLSRDQKKLLMVLADLLFISLALWSAYALRFAEWFPWSYLEPAWPLFVATPVIGVVVFAKLGLYRAVVRFMGNQAIWSVAYGAGALSISLYALAYLFAVNPFPRSIPI
ncbi:MAG: polysaccharide biosynthesis protein, partial [Litorivicinus sp.]